MKSKHTSFRVQAHALALPFSDYRYFLDPIRSVEPSTFEAFAGDAFDDVSRNNWPLDAWATMSAAFPSPCPLRNLQMYAAMVLQLGGPWMTLRPIAALGRIEAADVTRFEPGDEILRWRCLSLALPPLLYIAAAAPHGLVTPTRVRILDPSIAPAGEVALLHAHWSAMTDFELLWNELGAALLRGEGRRHLASQDNPVRAADGRDWIECLRKAFLVREILVQHLDHPEFIKECRRCRIPPPWQNVLHYFTSAPHKSAASVRVAHGYSWDEARESKFLRDALQQSLRQGDPYRLLYIQYLRAKVLVYRHLVADFRTGGLRSFKIFQRRIKDYAERVSDQQVAREIGRENGVTVRCAELRTTPGAWLAMAEGSRPVRSDAVESAWVVHFSRSLGVTSEPSRRRRDVRRAARARAMEARRLSSVIRARPNVLRHLRGLDVAGLEHEGPLWAFLTYLKSTRYTSRLAATQYGRGLEPLRLTVHVGEDFDHLASGLRCVHEPFAWHLMDRGDRLGHATALGIVPSVWSERALLRARVQNRPFMVRAWDRLLDIGWLHHAFRIFGLGFTVGDLDRLGAEAERLFASIEWSLASRHEAPAEAEALWLGLGLEPEGRVRARVAALRERVPEHVLSSSWKVAPDADIHLLDLVRKPLANLVAKSGVAIEVNPTSNMIIAGLPYPLQQPMFHLRPVDPREGGSISVVIGTDDQLTFATCLSDEFAYAWAGMVLGSDVAPNYARAWLEDAAAASMRMRFTCAEPSRAQGPAFVRRATWHDG